MTLLPEIEAALLDAVARDHAARDGRSVERLRRLVRLRARALALVAAMLVLTGSATAALMLAGERSAPLSGVVPAGQVPGSALVAGARYDIQIAPSIWAGQIGWCGAIGTGPRSSPLDSGIASCDATAPTATDPLFGIAPGFVGRGLAYVLTGPSVAAVRIPGFGTVLTRADARLPYGFRAAVFNLRGPTALARTVALNRSGQVISGRSGLPVEPTRSWFAGQPSVAGACSLSARRDSPIELGSGTVVTSLRPARSIIGRAFLPCVEVDVGLPAAGGTGSDFQAAVLLDAADPGALPAPLPGMEPVARHPGVFDRSTGDPAPIMSLGASAERIGRAWLVVTGGRTLSQRLTVMNGLRVGPVRRHPHVVAQREAGRRSTTQGAPR
jgi:hypothetical protein